jgi:response regulator of citrate/malate metabolism/predicted regulator of Ras-like GTPase activity (Roadblock/LC7/MglB family)
MEEYTVLLVGNDVIFVNSLRCYLLEKRNRYIKTAFNIKKALEILEKEKINLVIVDIKIPDMDIIQFVIEIFNRNIWKPLIILKKINTTANWKKPEIFNNFGIVEYIEKPVNLEKLDRSIDGVLNHFKIYQESASEIDLSIIMLMLESERKTGILTVKSGKKKGKIYLKEGDIVDVEVKGSSAEKALEKYLKSAQSKMKIYMEYINHKREKKTNILLSKMLPNNILSLKEYKIKNNKKEGKMAISENIFDSLSTISGFTAGAVYYGDGELVTQKSLTDIDPGKMGGLAVELYKGATSIVDKMGLGVANFIEVHTDEYSFIHTCVLPGVAALGVIVKKDGNIGLLKHEMLAVAKSLIKEFET